MTESERYMKPGLDGISLNILRPRWWRQNRLANRWSGRVRNLNISDCALLIIISYLCMQSQLHPSQRSGNRQAIYRKHDQMLSNSKRYSFLPSPPPPHTHIIWFPWPGCLPACCLGCGGILLINPVQIHFSFRDSFSQSFLLLRIHVPPYMALSEGVENSPAV